MEVTRAVLGLRAVDFIDVIAVLSVIGNEYEIDGKSFWCSEQSFWQLFGEGFVDEFLQS